MKKTSWKKLEMIFTAHKLFLIVSIFLFASLTAISCEKAGKVTVVDFSPKDKVIGKVNITVKFSAPVVEYSIVGKELTSPPLAFTPKIAGRFRWISTDTLRFYPDTSFLIGVSYTVEVLNKAIRLPHLKLTGNRIFKIESPAFNLEEVSAYIRYTDIKNELATIIIDFKFNYPVDPKDLRNNLSLALEKYGTLIIDTLPTAPQNQLSITTKPVKMGDEVRKLSVTIAKSLPEATGKAFLSKDYSKTMLIKRRGELKIEQIWPEQVGDIFQIHIQFSSYVNAKDAKPYISISPEIEYRLEEGYRGILLVGDFRPQKTYKVTIKKGLMADDASTLKHDFSQNVAMGDYRPSVKFSSPGFYLSRRGAGNIGLETVNVQTVIVKIYKIFPNNIVYFFNSSLSQISDYYNDYEDDYEGSYYGNYYYGDLYDIDVLGKVIKEEKISIASRRNQRIVTPLSISRFLEEKHRGIFIIAVEDEEGKSSDRKWVIATDLGIMTKMTYNEMIVFVNSLKTLSPYAAATVTLYSRNNQELATVKTNANGVATIPNIAALQKEFEPYLILVRKDEDFSVLKISQSEVSAADFDVGGFSSPEAWQYRTYIYTDRGIYRPSDRVNMVALIRTADLKVPTLMPVELIVRSPDMRVFKTLTKTLEQNGAAEFNIDIPDWAMTGVYSVELKMATEAELGSTTFQVEEFIPDQIDVTVTTDKPAYNKGEEITIKTKGMLLFGPPAANRKVSGICRFVDQVFESKRYPTYSFYDDSRSFEEMKIELGETLLDEKGEATFKVNIPTDLNPPSSLLGVVVSTVRDEGGRAVSAQTSFPVHPYSFYVGIKKQQEGYVEPGKPATFSVIALDTSGKEIANKPIAVELYRVIWHTTLQRDRKGYYRFVSEKKEDLLEAKEITSGSQPVSVTFTPNEYGAYRVVARAKDDKASAAVSFYASGWGYAPWEMSMPNRLEIDMDKKIYKPGEIAKVQVRAPFSGKLILTIERDRVYTYKIVNMEKNTANISIQVQSNWTPNVYVVGTLIRSTDSIEPYSPARAFGAFPLFVDNSTNKLNMTISAPDEMRPNQKLNIKLSVPNTSGNTWVTVAAVDEGILQLIDFPSPDPLKYFFSKQRLSVSTHDLYHYLLPELEGVKKQSSTGAEVLEQARRRHLNPVAIRRIKPVSLWSGLVKLDPAGKGEVEFSVPQFNGTLRVMAVAFDNDKFIGAQKAVIVADNIVLRPTLPRFLAPKDTFVIPVSIYNKTGRAGEFTVSVATEGPVRIKKNTTKIRLGQGKETLISFDAEAKNEVGKATITISASGNGFTTKDVTELPVRPASPLVIDSGSGVVTKEKPAKIKLPSDYLIGTERPRLVISSLPIVKFSGSLQYLLKYPYGCIEQVTSRAFPLLYFQDLAKKVEPELFGDTSADYYVNEAIEKIESMQLSSGGFSFWPCCIYESSWSTLWASHFLVEAQKAGYLVQKRAIDGIRKRLNEIATKTVSRTESYEFRRNLEQRVYALYILALMGDPNMSAMIYIKDNELSELPDYSRYQLAAAFAYADDKETAKKLLPKKIMPSSVERESGGNFNSPVRGTAIILSALADIVPNDPAIAVLIQKLGEQAKIGRYYTTQENALVLLALGKIYRAQPQADFTGKVLRGSTKELAKFDESGITLTTSELLGETLEISIEGEGNCFYFWQVEGVKKSGDVEEHDLDVTVRRRYLNKNGEELNPESLQQGDLIIGEITISVGEKDVDNLVIVDMLPAGLEIENPRLQSREAFQWVSEDKKYEDESYKDEGYNEFAPEYMDIRDDRLIIFVSVPSGKLYTFHYALRAVTAGHFVLPPIMAEAMYDPAKNSVASSGVITIRRISK